VYLWDVGVSWYEVWRRKDKATPATRSLAQWEHT